ncbi:unnamed protein product [Allacma fusca]|uniref:F-box domain-containing protein n=1 Tax=Allacma fusca TaxID=39272 RepID=A0A8J2P5D5_9HEXA|nr:unnamed protein product [Allacma fusca]
METTSPRKNVCVRIEGSFKENWHESSTEKSLDPADDLEEPCKFTLEALSNFLVVRNIFANLDNNDLESCSQVNQCWKSIADPIMIRYFRIEIRNDEANVFRNDENDFSKSTYVIIKRINSLFIDEFPELNCNLPDASKFLQNAMQTGKISIDLTINIPGYFKSTSIRDFLTKFGHLVERFSSNVYKTMNTLCENLVGYFPSLQNLNITDSTLESFGSTFNPNLPENQHQHLKTIHYSTFERSYKNLVAILSFAPNLKEFYNFPILKMKAAVITGKAAVIKSLKYPDGRDHSGDEMEDDEEDSGDETNSNRENFQTALEKFAVLEPKLAEFSFFICDDCPNEYVFEEPFPDLVKSILQSSHDSLERITMFPNLFIDLSDISPFTALKKISFVFGDDYCPQLSEYLHPDTLQGFFPKVSVLKMPDCDADCIPPCFPENLISPWGLQIKELNMKHSYRMTADVILLLSRSFPSVQKFNFNVRAVPEDLRLILPVIAEKWPGMESLTIKIQGCYIRDIKAEPCTFDSVFTGIPDETLEQLKDPLSRGNFSPEDIFAFHRKSPLVNMPNLKTIKMDFGNCTESAAFLERLSTVTFISKEFVFDYLPALKMSFRLGGKNYLPNHVQETLSSLIKIGII